MACAPHCLFGLLSGVGYGLYLYPNYEVGLLLTPIVMLSLYLGGVVMVV